MKALLLSALLLGIAACSAEAEKGNATAAVAPADPLATPARVTDAGGILSQEQERALAERLGALEARTQHQMVVVTVASLGNQDIAEFTRALANRWGIGRRGHNDGVVILVAPNERKVRIEVGTGLESVLTNELCRRIIEEAMTPRFREGDLAGGIEAGASALIERLERNGPE